MWPWPSVEQDQGITVLCSIPAAQLFLRTCQIMRVRSHDQQWHLWSFSFHVQAWGACIVLSDISVCPHVSLSSQKTFGRTVHAVTLWFCCFVFWDLQVFREVQTWGHIRNWRERLISPWAVCLVCQTEPNSSHFFHFRSLYALTSKLKFVFPQINVFQLL